jgi:hypothetical protein
LAIITAATSCPRKSITFLKNMRIDPLTVRFRTKNPDAALLFRLTQRFITNKAPYDRTGAVAWAKVKR